MRLWSLHPRFLDSRALVAQWREGLLALAVAQNRTRGYRHHPQMIRFLRTRDPAGFVERYLQDVLAEAETRGYVFDRSKIRTPRSRSRLTVTRGQLDYEWRHLLRKLYRRDRARWARQKDMRAAPHPIFQVVPGPVEDWERVRQR
jgi:hypothetical protein